MSLRARVPTALCIAVATQHCAPASVPAGSPASAAPPGATVAQAQRSQERRRLRSAPAVLSTEQAKIAIVSAGLHCKVWNESAAIEHDYEHSLSQGVLVVID